MTLQHQADPGTLSGAMHRVLQILGTKIAALVTSRTEGSVYAWGNPERPDSPPMSLALLLDTATFQKTGETPLFDVYRSQLEALTGQAAPKKPIGDVFLEKLQADGAFGNVASALLQAKDENSSGGSDISRQEGLALIALIETSIREIKDVESAVRQEASL